MTLSARIAVGPSLRLGLLTATLAVGGVVACVATIAARLPEATASAWTAGALAAALFAARTTRRHRDGGTIVLAVSDRADFDVAGDRPGLAGTHRLAASTMSWPGDAATGFSVVSLEPATGASWFRPVARIPIVHADLAPSDRRALSRFLSWSLHGGPASAGRSGQDAPRSARSPGDRSP